MHYKSYDDFIHRGLGFVCKKNNEIICVASSFASHENKVELQIDTSPIHRRKGYASQILTAFINECQKKSLVPHWDAANELSATLARKSGFHGETQYTMFYL